MSESLLTVASKSVALAYTSWHSDDFIELVAACYDTATLGIEKESFLLASAVRDEVMDIIGGDANIAYEGGFPSFYDVMQVQDPIGAQELFP